MKEITEIKETKEIGLNILLAIHRFCEEHHIMYSLACGTLIGAVRHKGFIPWDDDVDIYMKRDEYNRFMMIFPDVYEEKYSVISLERSAEWNRPYAKAFDIRTIEDEQTKCKIKGIGLGIDIFPIDEVPDDEKVWRRYEKRRTLLRDLYVLKGLTVSKQRSFFKNSVIGISSLLLYPWSFRWFALKINKNSQLFNGQGNHYLAENCYGVPNNRFPKCDFVATKDITFESYKLKVMIGYHDYLDNFYGDYMQLPPEEKRVAHHAFKAYWK